MKPINRKLSAVIKEGNEKLLKEFNDINSMISQFYDNITDCSANNKENFKQIFYNFNQLKENFIDFCKGLTENLIEQELIIKENSTNISEDKGSNSITKEQFIPKVKFSYDKIYQEFCKLEKTTKEIYRIKQNINEKRKKRIQILDKKLQSFMDEIKEINFKDISTSFDKLNIESPNEHTESVLNKADLLEDLESVKSIEVEIKDKTIVQRFEEKPENKNGINMNNAIINQILNLNASKEEDMIDFIESLLARSVQL